MVGKVRLHQVPAKCTQAWVEHLIRSNEVRSRQFDLARHHLSCQLLSDWPGFLAQKFSVEYALSLSEITPANFGTAKQKATQKPGLDRGLIDFAICREEILALCNQR
jgi:hypothetical protein